MRRAEEATLIVITNSKDKDGFPIKLENRFPVFVSEKSATRMEFYEAFRSGIRISLVLELRNEDWEQSHHIVDGKKAYATKVEFDGGVYDIVRSYRTNLSMVQISCS